MSWFLTCVILIGATLWRSVQTFELPPPVPSPSSSRPPTPPAPPSSATQVLQDTTKSLQQAITTLQPAQLRGGLLRSAEVPSVEVGSAEGLGGLLAQLLRVQELLAALSPAAAAAPAAGSAAAPPPPAAAPPAAPTPPDLAKLLQLLALAGGGSGSDDADEMALGYDDSNNMVNCTSDGIIHGVCDPHNSINKFIAFPDHVLAVGAEDVFKIGLDGTPIDTVGDPKFTVFQKLNGTPTASLQIENQFYLFLENDEVAVKDNRTNSSFQRMPVKELFFKVDKPVIGAFRFNEHTLALFYDTHFVFYQPLMNPPIDPRFSPQPNSVIPNGPDKIDGAVQINGTNYLYRQGWLYEIAKNEMVVVAKRPIRMSKGSSGWMKCGILSCN